MRLFSDPAPEGDPPTPPPDTGGEGGDEGTGGDQPTSE